MNHDDDLIDTTEMYLRTVLELEEEGIVPLRARIAGQLRHSVPTVSQTIARMQRDGLVTVTGHRRVLLTSRGRTEAVRVMRKHRLAECLLADILGMDWQLVHDEACRWEHVMSDAVERRVLEILSYPTHSPYGNPIPGLAELGAGQGDAFPPGLVTLADVAETAGSVIIRRIGEPLQSDTALLTRLRRAGFRPGASVPVSRADGHVRIGPDHDGVDLDDVAASHIFVTTAGQARELPQAS